MSYKLTFQPQSISNKNISFQNGNDDSIRFSYLGSFKQRGVDFEEIPLSAIFKAKAEGGWNCIQTMNPAWKTGGIKIANQDQKRQELALRLKHLYVDRNIYAINSIIHKKNRDFIEAKQKWANESLLVTIARVVLKTLSLGFFDFRDWLHQKYERKAPYGFVQTIHSRFLQPNRFSSNAVHSFADTLSEPNHAQFFHALKIKGQPAAKNEEDKLKQIREALDEFVKRPGAKIEDFLDCPKNEGCDFESLYRLDLRDIMGHASYMNGHIIEIQSSSKA